MRKKYGLLVVLEIVDPRDLETAIDYTDLVQIVSRNMAQLCFIKRSW